MGPALFFEWAMSITFSIAIPAFLFSFLYGLWQAAKDMKH